VWWLTDADSNSNADSDTNSDADSDTNPDSNPDSYAHADTIERGVCK
jgi:hypothetical protein